MTTCEHGCDREATVQHADGRVLCKVCYLTESRVAPGLPGCPTCSPERATVCPECGSGVLDGEHIANYPCSLRAALDRQCDHGITLVSKQTGEERCVECGAALDRQTL